MAAQVALTVLYMNDYCRRLLGKVPLYDLSGSMGDIGNPCPSQPDPNNQTILDALNQAIDWLNGTVRCGPTTWLNQTSVGPVSSGTSYNGPYPVDISATLTNTLLITEITDVVWSYTNSSKGQLWQRLAPINFYSMAAATSPHKQYPPDTAPVEYFITGTNIVLLPAPTVSGTLFFFQTEGVPQLTSSSSTIVGPPVSLHSVIYEKAVAILASRDGTNVEMSQRAAYFDAQAQSRLPQLVAWKNNSFDPTVADILRDSDRMIGSGEQQRRANRQTTGPGT